MLCICYKQIRFLCFELWRRHRHYTLSILYWLNGEPLECIERKSRPYIRKEEKGKNITGSSLEWTVISSSLTWCSNNRMNTVIPISLLAAHLAMNQILRHSLFWMTNTSKHINYFGELLWKRSQRGLSIRVLGLRFSHALRTRQVFALCPAAAAFGLFCLDTGSEFVAYNLQITLLSKTAVF